MVSVSENYKCNECGVTFEKYIFYARCQNLYKSKFLCDECYGKKVAAGEIKFKSDVAKEYFDVQRRILEREELERAKIRKKYGLE